MLKNIFAILLCSYAALTCDAAETFDKNLESQWLKNITQLTAPSMGFEKAGEAYFSRTTIRLSSRLFLQAKSITKFIP